MKSAFLIFQNVSDTLKKAKDMNNFKSQIELSIQSFTNEEKYKKQMNEFFVNKNLFYHLRRMFISLEDPNVCNDERFKKFVYDRISIFGVNAITGMSEDYISQLQPNYYSKGGIGRTHNTLMNNPERVFSLDNFLREETLINLRKITDIAKTKGKQIKSLQNIFGFVNQSDSDEDNNSKNNSTELDDTELIFARNFKIDHRAKQNLYDYSNSKSLVTNKPMLISSKFKVIYLTRP